MANKKTEYVQTLAEIIKEVEATIEGNITAEEIDLYSLAANIHRNILLDQIQSHLRMIVEDGITAKVRGRRFRIKQRRKEHYAEWLNELTKIAIESNVVVTNEEDEDFIKGCYDERIEPSQVIVELIKRSGR